MTTTPLASLRVVSESTDKGYLIWAIHNNYAAHYTLIDIKGTNGDSPPANIGCTWPANIDIVSMMVKNDIPKTLHKSLGIGVII